MAASVISPLTGLGCFAVLPLISDQKLTPVEKYYPPDTTAAIFWLKNRQKDKWRDKQEVEHTGEVNLIQRIQEARKRARGE